MLKLWRVRVTTAQKNLVLSNHPALQSASSRRQHPMLGSKCLTQRSCLDFHSRGSISEEATLDTNPTSVLSLWFPRKQDLDSAPQTWGGSSDIRALLRVYENTAACKFHPNSTISPQILWPHHRPTYCIWNSRGGAQQSILIPLFLSTPMIMMPARFWEQLI